MADNDYVYDPNDPGNQPAAPKPPDVWVEGDHPTENPDGVTNSNVDYMPKAQEEKADMLGVEMVVAANTPNPWDPYPTGNPPDENAQFEMLKRAHPPINLVPGDERQTASEKNLAAGGSVDQEELKALRTGL